MIYEMRIYRCVPGRLPALLQRFEKVTLNLWKKHGIRQAGFWTTLIGDSNHELTYLLAWESNARRSGPNLWAIHSGFPRVPKVNVMVRSFRTRATRSFSRPRFPR
jgi:hypothetical protein